MCWGKTNNKLRPAKSRRQGEMGGASAHAETIASEAWGSTPAVN